MTTKAVTADAPADVAPATAYLHNWDRLRVIASLDIIGSHLTGTHLLGGVGLPVFLIVSIALAVRRPAAGDRREFVRKRVARVLAPWAFWSAVITAELAWRAVQRGEAPFSWVQPAMLLYGPEIHLWFLPFSAAAAIGAHLLHRGAPPALPRTAAYLAFALGGITLALCPWFERGWPLEQWGFSLPAVCVGFGVGRLLSNESARPLARFELTLLAAAFVVAASLLPQSLPDVAPYAQRHAGAILLITLMLWLPNPPDPITHRLAPLMLGVYILHLFVFRELVEPMMQATGMWLGERQRIGMDFALTVVVVSLLRQTPLRRVL